jgi:hypothetical protein
MRMLSNGGQPVKKSSSHSFKITNENPSDKTEVLAMRIPAKTVHQLNDQYFDTIEDIFGCEIDVESYISGATCDSSDWYNLPVGDAPDLVPDPSVEISMNQPSKKH